MRLLLLNQYYTPDLAPTGQALHDLARVLVARGHSVRVVTSRRAYSGPSDYPPEESLDAVEIRRVGATAFGRQTKVGRVIDYLTYLVLACVEGFRRGWRPDLVLALTTPPYLGLVAAFIARFRSAGSAHWVMDLYPDTLIADGLVRPRGLPLRILQALARRQFKRARAIVALGPFMAAKVRVLAPPSALVTQVPLWSLGPSAPPRPGAVEALRLERGWSRNDVVLLYSGNMGRGHRVVEFLEAAQRLGPGGPVWAFAGGGARRGEVERAASAATRARIQLLSYVAADQLVESLSSADVLLVSLDTAWQGSIVPSKLQGSFAVGRPVIFVGGRENEIAAWIQDSGGGWVVAEGDIEGLLAAVASAEDPRERARRGAAALVFSVAHFDREANCARIAAILEEAAASSGAQGRMTGKHD